MTVRFGKEKNGKWYTYLPSDNGGRKQIKRNSKKDIEDIVVQFEKSQINNPMVSEIFEEWNNRRLELERISKSPHKIRKTYGTILLDSGVDNRLILDQMGHASIGTTERHYHRNRRNIDAKQNILNRIDDLAIAK